MGDCFLLVAASSLWQGAKAHSLFLESIVLHILRVVHVLPVVARAKHQLFKIKIPKNLDKKK